nr:DNA replication/repair protein RecF [Johnsonella ignava]
MSLILRVMIIKSLELKNYRNYKYLELGFDKNINILYGDNAQGKTNILEAVYMAASARSHRASKDRDIIKFGEDEAHIKLFFQKKGSPFKIDMHIKKNKAKGIAVNLVPIKRASELFGMVKIVFFSPEDLNLIKKGPSERRRFIDFELCQLDKLYIKALISYNKALIQRNKLLKDYSKKSEFYDMLDVWDIQLVNFGSIIINLREKFLSDLNCIMPDIHYRLTGKKEVISLHYDKNTSVDNFENMLKKSRETDVRLKMTNVGPHRDDISFLIDSKSENGSLIDLKIYGSQGQQRTAALSLKLAEISLVNKLSGDYPILLLDDVLSELDINRQRQLMSYIDNIQTIITCTGLEDIIKQSFDINRVINIKDGNAYAENIK